MAESDKMGVKTGELGALGSDFRRSASAVKVQAKRVTDHMFGVGNDEAGRNYSQEGSAVHSGLERIDAWLENWSDATDALGNALGASVVVYSEVDRAHASETDKQ
ncbi:hypothetical protein AB0E01_02330 [Nocardia vinacea]|uniref:hypothetical protein n=1 Tax=Nocardia vinacea TaxID=96468 RepID=UPI0033C26E85